MTQTAAQDQHTQNQNVHLTTSAFQEIWYTYWSHGQTLKPIFLNSAKWFLNYRVLNTLPPPHMKNVCVQRFSSVTPLTMHLEETLLCSLENAWHFLTIYKYTSQLVSSKSYTWLHYKLRKLTAENLLMGFVWNLLQVSATYSSHSILMVMSWFT